MLVGLLLLALAIESGLSQNLDTTAVMRWTLEARLAKSEYVLREPIWLDITITNCTVDTQRTHGLDYPHTRQFVIELKDGSGHSLGQVYHFDVMSAPGGLLLDPGQQDYASFDLAEKFGVVVNGEGNLLNFDFPSIPLGQYTVQVRFEEAVSAELTFQMVEPSGKAIEALAIIEQADTEWKQADPTAARLKFREAVDRFPDGPYTEMCHYLSLLFSPEVWNNFDTFHLMSLRRAMLEKYPNSGNAPDWIKAITQDMEPQANRAFLEELAKTHPDSRSAKYARLVQARQNSQKAGE